MNKRGMDVGWTRHDPTDQNESRGVSPLPSDQDRSGRSFDERELSYLAAVMESGILFGPKGTFCKALEAAFSDQVEGASVIATSSGTAAVHTAIAALDPEPGQEVITTSVTDMGALTPLLYQGVIPVFADVDPTTGNLTPESIEERISDRTMAIVVTHLFGNPSDMGPIVDLARERGIKLIEDCAQALGARYRNRPVGTFGDISCFSLQQGKHITSGEGGLVSTADPDLAHRARLYVNKAWDYDSPSDHEFLALNYRMSELQAAVALAQLEKLDEGVTVRKANALALDGMLDDVAGVESASQVPNAAPSYWRYALLVDPEAVPGGNVALSAELRDMGVPSAARYIQKPAFRCGIFVNKKTLGSSSWPFTLARPEAIDYSAELFPGTFELLDRIVVIPWNEKFTETDVGRLGDAIVEAAAKLRREAA